LPLLLVALLLLGSMKKTAALVLRTPVLAVHWLKLIPMWLMRFWPLPVTIPNESQLSNWASLLRPKNWGETPPTFTPKGDGA